ncbi:MAG: hypothetical protein R6U20_10835 [Longimonas sp.]|uniref:hypothetical protein n=1 Tax=Longimonas sp. TaxID=2039626 RepID=UPI003976A833
MATLVPSSTRSALRSVASAFLVLIVTATLAALPSLAQSEGGEGGNEALQRLEQTYRQGMQAGEQGDHEVAYNNLSEAIELAEQEEQERALARLVIT